MDNSFVVVTTFQILEVTSGCGLSRYVVLSSEKNLLVSCFCNAFEFFCFVSFSLSLLLPVYAGGKQAREGVGSGSIRMALVSLLDS